MATTEANEDPMITARTVDLTNCDREEIQFCGAIQPHAALVVVKEAAWTVQYTSANSFESCLEEGRRESVLDRSLGDLIGDEYSMRVRKEVARQRTLTCPPIFLFTARLPEWANDLHLFAHRNDDGFLILEFEGISHDGPVPVQDLYTEACAPALRIWSIPIRFNHFLTPR